MKQDAPTTRIEWQECWSVVPSQDNEADVFARIAPPEDLDSLRRLEGLTNRRNMHENGLAPAVPNEERISCEGAHYIMSSFIHLSPTGSRFSDGSFGVFYGGESLDTAIAETKFHREMFLKSTRQPPIRLEMRALVAGMEAELHDLRSLVVEHPDLLHPSDYSCPRLLGKRLWEQRSWGLIYPSVRAPGGTCVGIFRPTAFLRCHQDQRLQYVWDGEKIRVK